MLHQPTSWSVTVSSHAPGRMPNQPVPAKVTAAPPAAEPLPPPPPPPFFMAARVVSRTMRPLGYTAVGTG